MKLRPTKERSPTSMLLEPPLGVNGTDVPPDATPRFGHMKFVALCIADAVWSLISWLV